jgi:hypothetical protein
MALQSPHDERIPATRLLRYWRACVAHEAALAAAAEHAAALSQIELETVAAGRVPAALASSLVPPDAAGPVRVLVAIGRLAPKRRAAAPERAEMLVPLWIPALLTPGGELLPAGDDLPFLARSLLEPTTSPLSIGTLADAATFQARSTATPGSWSESWAWAMALWEAVVKEPFVLYAPGTWRFEPSARVVAWESGLEPRALLSIFDGVLERAEDPNALPLLEGILTGGAGADGARAAQSGHFDDEPLTGDERLALRRALALRAGDALAVDAPPGAGSALLVRSLVASLAVDAVTRTTSPLDAVAPLIAVLVPGEEAAANWLEAFDQDDGTAAGRRWIAQTGGYAVHLTSGERDASAADRGYPTLQHGLPSVWPGDGAPGPALAAELERTYLESFTQAYGRAAVSLDDALAQLHAMTRDWTARMEAYSRARESYTRLVPPGTERSAARARAVEPFDANVGSAARQLDVLDAAYALAERAGADELQRLGAASKALEPKGWYENAFFWLESVTQRRLQRFAEAFGQAPPQGLKSAAALRSWIKERHAVERARSVRALAERDEAAQLLARAKAERAAALGAFDETLASWDDPAYVAASRALDAPDSEAQEPPDDLFDRVHRREAFRCAARFWEGLRLRESMRAQETAPEVTSAEARLGALRSGAMLHPVAVATLPALAAWYGASTPNETPLYAALDALVVVDAEQVDVALGSAVLPLAKRLIALGDPHGREPLVQLDETRSRAALRESIDDSALRERLERRCLLSYDRSGASLAKALPARVALATLRACAPEIVACCDELAYHGLRAAATAPPRDGLPALGYAHVRGRGEARGASRVNEPEARTVVQFLVERRAELLRAYPQAKCLADVVSIVTPFRAQASFIAERLADALRACRMRAEPDLAITTPFALRGARPVVLYSHVLGPGDDGALVDGRPNALALTLWSATDHFFFFGDVRGLAKRPADAPSGVLAKHLLARAGNRLEGLPTSFYGADAELAAIDTPEGHLALLDEALANATEQLTIVSPLAERDLSSGATLRRLAELAGRGVRVSVFSNAEPSDALAASPHIEWHELDTVLASALAIDRSALYEGSFAWLGAGGEPGAARSGMGWLARGPGAAAAVDELRRYYQEA